MAGIWRRRAGPKTARQRCPIPASMAGNGEKVMATLRREFRSRRSAEEVWAVLKQFDRVHELAKGFVVASRMEPSGARVVTFANGMEVREWFVSADDGERRLVYAITDNPRYAHYNASAQVFEDGAG